MKLNEKILYYRKRVGLSQEALAAKIGVSRQAVSKWEVGDTTPELDKLLGLARAFGVTTDHLLDDGAEPSAPTSVAEAAPPPPPAPAASEDLRWLLERRAKFNRWYLPIFMGAIFAVIGAVMIVMLRDTPDLPFIQQTFLPIKIMCGVLVAEGVGMVIWGIVRLIRHRKEKNGENQEKKR